MVPAKTTESKIELSFSMPLKAIQRNKNNPRGRVQVEDVDELARSIKRDGVLQPILITTDFEIIAGERRYVAAILAGLTHIPVIIAHPENDDERFRWSLSENIHRQNLPPITEAKVYQAMIKSGASILQISDQLNIGVTKIRNSLNLLELPDFIQEAVEADKISIAGGLALRGIKDHELQKEIALEAIDNNYSKRQIKEKKVYANNGAPKTPTIEHVAGIHHSCDATSLLTAAMAHINRLESFISEQVGAKFIPVRPPRLM